MRGALRARSACAVHVADVFGAGRGGGRGAGARPRSKLLDPSARASRRSTRSTTRSRRSSRPSRTRIYGADGVEYPKRVDRQIAQAEALGYGRLPVCVAKTQRSLSDDPTLLNRPRGFTDHDQRGAHLRGRRVPGGASPGTSRPCRGCRAGPTPRAWTSRRTATITGLF